MKKFVNNKISLLLCCVLLLAASCIGCQSSPAQVDTVQEPTNKLVVYGSPLQREWMDTAIYVYKQKYPDVAVDYQAYGQNLETYDGSQDYETYKENLIADINAGKGPDVVIHFESAPGWEFSEFDDMYKAMESGAFVDLDVYTQNDPEFDRSLYNEIVLDGARYQGK